MSICKELLQITKWEASCLRTARECKDCEQVLHRRTKRANTENNTCTPFSLTVARLDHIAWPSLTRKNGCWEQAGLPVRKAFGDVFIDSLGCIGTLSKQRTTSDPVLSSGICRTHRSRVQAPSPGSQPLQT